MSTESQTRSVVSALGTLIGYLGSGAATEDVFERLLWPQRFANGVSWRDIIQIGLLTPMGGPLHKASLDTLDKFHKNGLFKGQNLGNMLGTAFFHDSGLKYKINGLQSSVGKEDVRNGLWVRAVTRIPLPTKGLKEEHPEAGEVPRIVRARSVVNYLELSYNRGKVDPQKVVEYDTGNITLRTLFAIVWSEITGLIVGGFALGYWHSYFCCIWFFPLMLKLVSTIFMVNREPLKRPPEDAADGQKIDCFEINTRGQGFMLIEGPESVILQFFRHYGHPVRCRGREAIQLAMVLGFGSVFPTGLMCSLLWMPEGLQYTWLGYQLYATVALYIYRFTRGNQWATTESKLAQKLKLNDEGVAFLKDDRGITVMGKLTRTYVKNQAEGQRIVDNILAQRLLNEDSKKLEADSDQNSSSSLSVL